MAGPPLSLALEESPSPDVIRFLVGQLLAFNERHHPGAQGELLGASLRDAAGELVGGALGSLQWGWLQVSHLWVPVARRGEGLGRRLLARLEAGAVARGCHSAWVDTFGFQARGFYERQGYVLFGELPDFPRGGSLYFLKRRLVAPDVGPRTGTPSAVT
jgi:GNAT superfamily N-acetyltransferase